MHELSIFTGAGGGIIGSILLGWRTVGAVENQPYPCAVLAQRQRDGLLDEFPIWCMDIEGFNRRVACHYRGVADIVTAGFPCQPFSVAGKRAGSSDERNMWPATMECIRLVRPRFAFLENVPGLLTWNGGDYFRTILGDLSEAGFNAEWMVLGADDCGAPHRRKRLWVLAYAEGLPERTRLCANEPAGIGGRRFGDGRYSWWDADPADAERQKLEIEQRECCDDGKERKTAQRACDQWGRRSTEPRLGRVAHGVAHRVERLGAIGNGQVPLVAARAFSELFGRITE